MLVRIDEDYRDEYYYTIEEQDGEINRYTPVVEIDDELFAAYKEFQELREIWDKRLRELSDQAEKDSNRRCAEERVLDKQLKEDVISGITI